MSLRFLHPLLVLAFSVPSVAQQPPPTAPTLRSAYADDFLIGVALGPGLVTGRDPKSAEIAVRQFSAVTPENDLKWQSLHPRPGIYQFNMADAYADFAAKNDMKLIGHTLVWHSQTPGWVFEGDNGQPAKREQLLARMREHIQMVVGRYKGRV